MTREPTDTEGKLPMKDTDKRELKKRSEGAPKKTKTKLLSSNAVKEIRENVSPMIMLKNDMENGRELLEYLKR